VLPGVTVELTGEHMPGSQSSVTSDRGTYRFVNLPPGSYDLLFTLQGFRTLRHPAMRVSVGATITVDVSLEIGEFAEAVTVVAQTPTVDTTTNKVSTIYEEEWIRSAPQGRSDFFDLKTSV
jgi:hypothetical protein